MNSARLILEYFSNILKQPSKVSLTLTKLFPYKNKMVNLSGVVKISSKNIAGE